jgi:transcriptional regulator with XRE-family HTH domain
MVAVKATIGCIHRQGVNPMRDTFMRNIKILLETKDMTQSDLARAISVSAPQVNRWLNGKCGVTIENIYGIAKGLGVSPGLLLDPEYKGEPKDGPVSSLQRTVTLQAETIKKLNELIVNIWVSRRENSNTVNN